MSKILDLVLAGTPAQFDKDTSLATTEFVQRALGNVSGQVNVTTNNYTLAVADVGKRINANSAGINIYLPQLAQVPVGAVYWVHASAACTIFRQGADSMLAGLATPTSIAIPAGGFAKFIAGDGNWNIEGGDAELGYSPLFAAQLTNNGYQKLPGGLIVQWGNASPTGSADAAVTFPIAFPTAALKLVVSAGVSGSGTYANFNGLTAAGVNIASWSASATRAAATCGWIAIGY